MIHNLGSNPSATAQHEPLPKTGTTATDLLESSIKVEKIGKMREEKE